MPGATLLSGYASPARPARCRLRGPAGCRCAQSHRAARAPVHSTCSPRRSG
ncbi:MAG: hypothetical protein MZU91_08565 [Desulfosudis oleivorans]|nr:hypothetical protein [Desulfosudis oleivorans]